MIKKALTSAEASELQQLEPFDADKKTLCQRIYDQVANMLMLILVVAAVVSAIRAETSTDSNTIVTNAI